jgi:hypothetical protein
VSSSRVFINTGLQTGVLCRRCPSRLTASIKNDVVGWKAVETAAAKKNRGVTWLKPGVNEMFF